MCNVQFNCLCRPVRITDAFILLDLSSDSQKWRSAVYDSGRRGTYDRCRLASHHNLHLQVPRRIRPTKLQKKHFMDVSVLSRQERGSILKHVYKPTLNLYLKCLWIALEIVQGVVEPSQVRFSATADKNETHLTSTMTLTNVTAYDTGYFSCKAIYRDEIKQYVYVYGGLSSIQCRTRWILRGSIFFSVCVISDRKNAVIKDDPQFWTKQESGEPLLIGCRPTHPNVTVVLLRLTRHVHPKEETNYQWDYSKVNLEGKKTNIFFFLNCKDKLY